MNNVYRLLTIAVLLLLMKESQRMMKTWANPVVFYAGPFAGILSLQQILLPDLAFGASAGSLIAGSAMTFMAGALIIWSRHSAEGVAPRYRRVVARSSRWLKFGVFTSFALALYYLSELRQIRTSGAYVINGVFYREDFFAAGGQTLTMRLLQALTYVGVFYIAFAATIVRKRALMLALMVLIMMAQSSAASSKMPVMLALIMIFAVFATIQPAAFSRLRPAIVLGSAAALAVTLLAFALVTQDRSQGAHSAVATAEYALLGSPSALSELLDGRQSITEQRGFGASFGGITSALGGPQRQVGEGYQSAQLSPGVYESQVNIYTWFVPLRHDFGTVGMFGLIGVLGAVLTSLFVRARRGRLGVPGLSVLALGNLTLIFAPINALTYYNLWFVLLALSVPLSFVFRLVDPEPASQETAPIHAAQGAVADGWSDVRDAAHVGNGKEPFQRVKFYWPRVGTTRYDRGTTDARHSRPSPSTTARRKL